MLIYNIYKWLYYTVGLVIIEGGGRDLWYDVGPTLKTTYLDYYRVN